MKKTLTSLLFLFALCYSALAQVTVESVANWSCSPLTYNGSAYASVGGNTSSYSFQWYIGADLSTPIAGNTTSVLTNLGPGTYSVRVTDLSDGSEAGTAQFIITDASAPPFAMINSSPNTGCSGLPNGTLTAVTTDPDDYTFEWHPGPDVSAGVIGINSTLSNLAGGTYTVKITEIITGCSAFVSAGVADECAVDGDIIVETVPKTHCATPNGSASVSVNGVTTGYTFEWFAGTTATGPVDFVGATVSNLDAGDYIVRVTNNADESETGTHIFSILDESIYSDLIIYSIPNTHCSLATANGSATITTLNAPEEDHTFAWYTGDSPTGDVISTSAALTNAIGGTYTVLVTNVVSGCVNEWRAIVADNPDLPAVNISGLSNTNCNVPNGALTANTEGPSTDYTFEWHAGAAGGIAPGTSQTIESLPHGTYSVKVTEVVSACSVTKTADVLDGRVFPNVTLTSSPNSMCTATASNGSIDAMITNGSENDHDFKWYESLSTTGSVISTSATLTDATAGEYAVQVTNTINGCTTEANAMVVDEPAIPMVTLNKTDNTTCNSPNGTVTANTEGPAADYNFEWYEGEEAEGEVIGAIQSISNLSQGIYNVRVTDLTTACAIQLVAIVADALVLPGITIDATPNGDCSGSHPNGELRAIVDHVAEGDRNIAWYAGENPEGEIIETASTLTGLSAGTYTIKVINEITGCLDVATATIDNVPNTPVITVNVVNNTSCVDSPNGELTASTEGPAGDYTFNWYEGEILSGNYIGSGVTQNSLAAGMYTVEAADINTGCASSVSALVADDCTITGNSGSATKDNISLECYPNPASTSLRVISRVNGTISLIDMTGRTFVTHAVSPSPDPVTLDLSGMPDGRYLVRLKEGWKITYHQIVVEK